MGGCVGEVGLGDLTGEMAYASRRVVVWFPARSDFEVAVGACKVVGVVWCVC